MVSTEKVNEFIQTEEEILLEITESLTATMST